LITNGATDDQGKKNGGVRAAALFMQMQSKPTVSEDLVWSQEMVGERWKA
jgi:hypothetical protein